MKLLGRLSRKIRSFWLKPIDIFVFHKVGKEYQPLYGGVEDWTEIRLFEKNIVRLQEKYEFISLEEAYLHLKKDVFRFKRYAALTVDDGYQAVMEILPWLESKGIPITLFLSVKYLDGKSYDPWFDKCWADIAEEKKKTLVGGMYIQKWHLDSEKLVSDNVTLSIHGYGHDDVSVFAKDDFEVYVDKCLAGLKSHPRFAGFYAYTWGRHSVVTDTVLHEKGLVPLLCDDSRNWVFDGALHRICIDGKEL